MTLLCRDCQKTKIPKGHFRCDSCASKAIMDPKKKNLPISGQTLWKNGNGNFVPRPSA